nr:retrovirus-related Pol polyprotein from transposon TNT 1-94 [Tanacetum cinerariifolium]
ELSYQERKCRLYNLFDKFAYVQGETLYEYYWRFSQLINDMYTIGITMQQLQVNTKFLNALPPKWSKFVTDVKLEKISPQPFISPPVTLQSQAEYPQLDTGLAIPTFQQGEDLIDCITKALAFLSIVASRFPPLNNQLKTSSNPRNQATIQDGRVTRNCYNLKGNYVTGQAKVVKCYNYLREGHMVKQCTQSKRPRSSTWFKEKLMLAKAQEAAFQTEDLDGYDLYYDDISSSKAVLMANLSSCDSDVLSEVVQVVLWYLDFECSKHMTKNCSQLINFMSKFLGLVILVFTQGDNPIACLNKGTAFLSSVATSRQRLLNVIIVKEKDRWLEQLAFLAGPGILDGKATQTTIPNNAAFQIEYLDAYDSDCDNFSMHKRF